MVSIDINYSPGFMVEWKSSICRISIYSTGSGRESVCRTENILRIIDANDIYTFVFVLHFPYHWKISSMKTRSSKSMMNNPNTGHREPGTKPFERRLAVLFIFFFLSFFLFFALRFLLVFLFFSLLSPPKNILAK